MSQIKAILVLVAIWGTMISTLRTAAAETIPFYYVGEKNNSFAAGFGTLVHTSSMSGVVKLDLSNVESFDLNVYHETYTGKLGIFSYDFRKRY